MENEQTLRSSAPENPPAPTARTDQPLGHSDNSIRPGVGRPMQKRRFLSGLCCSATGVALMLTVAAGGLQQVGITGRMSLPAVGICMIFGLMLLGGGFGIMATAAPKFDDGEFERLIRAGEEAARRNRIDRRVDVAEKGTQRNPANRQRERDPVLQ